MTTKTTTISPRKARKERDRIQAAIWAIDDGFRSLTSSESEVITYLKRDLGRIIPFCQESAPQVDSLFR